MVLEMAPSVLSTRLTSFPLGTFRGTCAFTWYNPAKPGVKPENDTFAATPPIIGTTVESVCERGFDSAAAPVKGGLVTGPRPTPKIVRYSPTAAGLAPLTRLPSTACTTARIPGALVASATVARLDGSPFTITCTVKYDAPLASHGTWALTWLEST